MSKHHHHKTAEYDNEKGNEVELEGEGADESKDEAGPKPQTTLTKVADLKDVDAAILKGTLSPDAPDSTLKVDNSPKTTITKTIDEVKPVKEKIEFPETGNVALPLQIATGNTIKATATDVIMAEQAKAAGDDPPKELPKNTGTAAAAGYLTVEQALGRFSGEPVKMNFPSTVYLNTGSDSGIIIFPQGHNDVPGELADHPYLKASEVSKVEAAPVREPEPIQEGKAPKTAQKEKK